MNRTSISIPITHTGVLTKGSFPVESLWASCHVNFLPLLISNENFWGEFFGLAVFTGRIHCLPTVLKQQWILQALRRPGNLDCCYNWWHHLGRVEIGLCTCLYALLNIDWWSRKILYSFVDFIYWRQACKLAAIDRWRRLPVWFAFNIFPSQNLSSLFDC